MFSTLVTYAKAAWELLQTPWVIISICAAWNATMFIGLRIMIRNLNRRHDAKITMIGKAKQ